MSDKQTLTEQSLEQIAESIQGRKRVNVTHPKVLNGAKLPHVVLPADFDLSVHRRIAETGIANPISSEELAKRIAELESKLPK